MTSPFAPLTKEAVADVLCCTTRTIENMVNSGELPAPARIAGRVFWHPDVFYSWLDRTLRGDGLGDGLPEWPSTTSISVSDGKKSTVSSKVTGKDKDAVARMQSRQATRLMIPQS